MQLIVAVLTGVECLYSRLGTLWNMSFFSRNFCGQLQPTFDNLEYAEGVVEVSRNC